MAKEKVSGMGWVQGGRGEGRGPELGIFSLQLEKVQKQVHGVFSQILRKVTDLGILCRANPAS